MKSAAANHWLALADLLVFPAFVLWFIWRGQFTARWTWVFFVVWLAASFLLQKDSPKTLGWRSDNLWPAAESACVACGIMAAALIVIGLLRGAWPYVPPSSISPTRLAGYMAFCMLQQVALNSLVHNRMMSLVRNEWVSACFTGAIFAACHWPNPVLVPLTFVGGAVMAWMFGRVRNIIPLAVGQALVSTLASWAFPMAWHHHFRVGPGYYNYRG